MQEGEGRDVHPSVRSSLQHFTPHPGLLGILYVAVCFLLAFFMLASLRRCRVWLETSTVDYWKESKVGVTVWARPEIAVSIVAVLSKPSLLEHTDVFVMLFTARHWPLYIGH